MDNAVSFKPIKTNIFRKGQSISDFIVDNIENNLVHNSMILAVTSKIVSLSEGRLVSKESISKAALIESEADHNFGEVGYGCYLTIKHGLFIPSAGIDESNSENGDYILYPKDPFASARNIWLELRSRWKINNLGIVITDSHTTPLRRGVTGISLAHWGFRGVRSMIGTPDLFGRELQMTSINVADGLAAGATLFMGEGGECQPLAYIGNADVTFVDEVDPQEVCMPLLDDLYFPFFKRTFDL